jgi:hypothetical protein
VLGAVVGPAQRGQGGVQGGGGLCLEAEHMRNEEHRGAQGLAGDVVTDDVTAAVAGGVEVSIVA